MADTDTSKLSVPGALRKISRRSAERWEKDDLLDVLFWWRQIMSIVVGILWGYTSMTGLYGFLMFFAGTAMLTVMFYRTWLGIDEEEYGGTMELAFEGMAGAMPLFLLIWTIAYSASQF